MDVSSCRAEANRFSALAVPVTNASNFKSGCQIKLMVYREITIIFNKGRDLQLLCLKYIYYIHIKYKLSPFFVYFLQQSGIMYLHHTQVE